MPAIRLIAIDAALADALDADAFEARYGAMLPDPAGVRTLVGETFAGLVGAPPPWGGYLASDAASSEVVGTCAFKSAPVDGLAGPGPAVEIAYWTFEPFERQGYATAMAAVLVSIAAAAPEVRTVVAHTLPETGASTRVLAATGFTFAGDVVDPDDGPVWRWTLGLPLS